MYNAEVKESYKALTAKERIAIKDTTGAIRLDEATMESEIEIKPINWAVLAIHNDKAEDKDYETYVVIDESGLRYITGSKSFWASFRAIFDEMQSENEDYMIKVYRRPSTNYKGKDFITCSIM